MKYILYSIVVICLFIFGSGCTPEPPQSQKKSEAPRVVKKKVKKKVAAPGSEAKEKTQKDKDKEEYSYTPSGKPDPFRPLLVDSPVKRKTSPKKDFLTPLQKYDLSDLKLVAVVVSEGQPTAMLEDPTGYGYVVRKGALVGTNEGVVERVTPSGLIIKEKIYNADGEVETTLSTITIQNVE